MFSSASTQRLAIPAITCFLAASAASTLAASFVLSEFTGNLTTNGGFETTETTGGGRPTSTAHWAGDAASIVTAEQGVSPLEGSQMLRFDGSRRRPPGATLGSEVMQLIDLNSYATEISSGEVVASASSYFNRIAGDAETDTEFRVILRAYNTDPSTFDTDILRFSLEGETRMITDPLTGTWEFIATDIHLPSDTTYVAVIVSALENVFNDVTSREFDGHYADRVSLTLSAPTAVPAQGPFLGLTAAVFGCLMLGARRQS